MVLPNYPTRNQLDDFLIFIKKTCPEILMEYPETLIYFLFEVSEQTGTHKELNQLVFNLNKHIYNVLLFQFSTENDCMEIYEDVVRQSCMVCPVSDYPIGHPLYWESYYKNMVISGTKPIYQMVDSHELPDDIFNILLPI